MFYTFNHSSVSHEQLVTDWAPEVGFLGKKEVRLMELPEKWIIFNGSKIFPVYLKCSTLKNHHKCIWQK